MRILLDTCILAELRHPQGNPEIKKAVNAIDDKSLYLSVLTVAEIAKGIELLENDLKKSALNAWLTGLEQQFADRILLIDKDTSRIWGEVTAQARKKGIIIPVSDGLIAATAMRHGLHIMTRNVKYFSGTGALIYN